jgi:hypothetical protein
MGFCKKCGRPRSGDNRFCAGCGTEFPAVQAVEETYVQPIEEAQTAVPVTAPPPAVEATRIEPMPAAAYGPPEPAADSWRTDDTVYAAPPQTRPPQATPPQATGFPPPAPAFPPPSTPAFQPASTPAGPRRRSVGGRSTAFIIVGVVVALAAGGGAYALVSRSPGHATAQPPARPAVTVPASAAASIAPSSSSPTASASAAPSLSPTATATPSPAQTGTVRAAPGVVGNPAEPQVDAYLNRYFNSINTRNYSEYNSLLDAQKQQADSRSGFDSGFATTKDSNEVLTGIVDTGGGSLTANVSFTSRQSPADSIDQSACNNWQLSVFLVSQGKGYVMTAAPAGYRASHTDC